MFRAIKLLYQRGRISKANVAEYVVKELITAEEYKEITGEAYTA